MSRNSNRPGKEESNQQAAEYLLENITKQSFDKSFKECKRIFPTSDIAEKFNTPKLKALSFGRKYTPAITFKTVLDNVATQYIEQIQEMVDADETTETIILFTTLQTGSDLINSDSQAEANKTVETMLKANNCGVEYGTFRKYRKEFIHPRTYLHTKATEVLNVAIQQRNMLLTEATEEIIELIKKHKDAMSEKFLLSITSPLAICADQEDGNDEVNKLLEKVKNIHKGFINQLTEAEIAILQEIKQSAEETTQTEQKNDGNDSHSRNLEAKVAKAKEQFKDIAKAHTVAVEGWAKQTLEKFKPSEEKAEGKAIAVPLPIAEVTEPTTEVAPSEESQQSSTAAKTENKHVDSNSTSATSNNGAEDNSVELIQLQDYLAENPDETKQTPLPQGSIKTAKSKYALTTGVPPSAGSNQDSTATTNQAENVDPNSTSAPSGGAISTSAQPTKPSRLFKKIAGVTAGLIGLGGVVSGSYLLAAGLAITAQIWPILLIALPVVCTLIWVVTNNFPPNPSGAEPYPPSDNLSEVNEGPQTKRNDTSKNLELTEELEINNYRYN